MLKSAALAGLAIGLMTVPAQAAKVVKTTMVNPPGPKDKIVRRVVVTRR